MYIIHKLCKIFMKDTTKCIVSFLVDEIIFFLLFIYKFISKILHNKYAFIST